LLSRRSFLLLVGLAVIATFSVPMYTNTPIAPTDSVARTAGILLTVGAILYSITVFRENLEKEQVKEIKDTNLKLEELAANLEERIKNRTQELEQITQETQQRAT